MVQGERDPAPLRKRKMVFHRLAGERRGHLGRRREFAATGARPLIRVVETPEPDLHVEQLGRVPDDFPSRWVPIWMR